MSDAAAPAQSALYYLARALIRSGAIGPDDLLDAARAVEREGAKSYPDDEAWDEWAHAIRLAALNLDDPETRPTLGVIDGGKGR